MTVKAPVGPYYDDAVRSHRLFLHLHRRLEQSAAAWRRRGRDVVIRWHRTVDTEYRRTRIDIIEDDVITHRLLYRCDGGIRPWGDPDAAHLRDHDTGQRYYALPMNNGPRVWSAKVGGREPHFSSKELVNGWFIPQEAP